MDTKEKRKKIRELATSLKLCNACLCNDARPGKKQCQGCADNGKKQTYKRRAKIGYCNQCGARPPVKGGKLCLKCRAAALRAQRKRRRQLKLNK